MKVKDDLGRVNESAPPRVPSALRIIYAPPELACSPRLPIMARLPPLSTPVRFGPVSARSEDCTVLSQIQLQPPFVYIQRIDDNVI